MFFDVLFLVQVGNIWFKVQIFWEGTKFEIFWIIFYINMYFVTWNKIGDFFKTLASQNIWTLYQITLIKFSKSFLDPWFWLEELKGIYDFILFAVSWFRIFRNKFNSKSLGVKSGQTSVSHCTVLYCPSIEWRLVSGIQSVIC